MIQIYGFKAETAKKILTPPITKEIAAYIKAAKDGEGLASKFVKGLPKKG